MMKQLIYAFTMCAMCVGISVCSERGRPSKPPTVPDALIVLPGAIDIKYSEEYDGVVRYRLREPFPADSVIAAVNSRLEQRKWLRKNDDLFNPGVQNSHVRGWSNYTDRNDDTVFVWTAEWSSNRGDIIQYGLNYRYRKGETAQNTQPLLEVTGIYMSAITVNQLREKLPNADQRSKP